MDRCVMETRIVDARSQAPGIAIADLECGTWFIKGIMLAVKVAYDVVVDARSGMRVAFNDTCKVTPVSVEITILDTPR